MRQEPERSDISNVVLGMCLWAVLTAIILWGGRPIDIREGERARHDYRARVDFEWHDWEETRARQDRAERDAPEVFIERIERLDELQREFAGLLHAVAEAGGMPDPAPAGWEDLRKDEAQAIDAWLRSTRAGPQELAATIFGEAIERGVVGRDWVGRDLRKTRIKILRGFDGGEGRLIDGGSVLKTVDEDELRDDLAELLRPEMPSMRSSNRKLVAALLAGRFQPTLLYSVADTEAERRAAREAVLPVEVRFREGDVLLYAGRRATEDDIALLEQEERVNARLKPEAEAMGEIAGAGMIAAVSVLILALFIATHETVLARSRQRLIAFGLLVATVAFLGKAIFWAKWSPFAAPVAAGSIIITAVQGASLALVTTPVLAFLAGVVSGSSYPVALSLFCGGAVAVFASRSIRKRTTILRVGALAGLVQAGVTAGVAFVIGTDTALMLRDALWSLCNGLAVGAAVTVALPLVEGLFRVTTDISLLELSDQNHPALRRMILEAPGTYHHSMMVGNLAEAAAETIGANSLLARVGSYYHDIGKLVRPDYFIENIPAGYSPHQRISPVLSTLIISAHTTDGAALAREFRLPPAIVDVVLQHHGTSVIEFFRREAKATGSGEDLPTSQFRYSGPRPATQEAAIISLADGAEALSRSLTDPSPARIERAVGEMIRRRLADGQMDDSPITFAELTVVRERFVWMLTKMLHSRIKYPDERT